MARTYYRRLRRLERLEPRLLLASGSGAFSNTGQLLGDEYMAAHLGDIDNDGDVDAVYGPRSILRNDGHGYFVRDELDIDDLSNTRIQAIEDFDLDGDLDMLFGTTLWLNDGSGVFVETVAGLSIGTVVAVGDIDGDGDSDLIDHASVWRNDGNAAFTPKSHRWRGGELLGIFDYNSDDALDVIQIKSVNGLRGAVTVYENDGQGNFVDAIPTISVPGAAFYPSNVDFADMDNDGSVDVIVSSEFEMYLLFNTQMGGFTPSEVFQRTGGRQQLETLMPTVT